MKYFSYKAVNESGQIHKGVLAVAGAQELHVSLSESGLTLLSYRRSLSVLRFEKRWSRREVIDLVFFLQQMLSAGIPLLEALQEYKDATSASHVKTALNQLIRDVDNGKKLSQACAGLPAAFDSLVVSMIDVGEQSGTLDQVLEDLGALLKWQDETASNVKRVMIYPAFVSVVLLSVIVFVMTWLVPGLVSFVKSAGAQLPGHTRALIATSDFIVQFSLPIVGVLGACIFLAVGLVKKNHKARYFFESLLLRVPLLGPVLFKIKLARFARCASMMYGAGLSLIDTLKHSEGIVDNALLANTMATIRGRIIDGESISACFTDSAVLPPLIGRLMRVGESTGALDSALDQLGYFYDRESKEAIEKLEQSIGPVMIITVGSIMMWVVISVMGPIYSLVFNMSGQI